MLDNASFTLYNNFQDLMSIFFRSSKSCIFWSCVLEAHVYFFLLISDKQIDLPFS